MPANTVLTTERGTMRDSIVRKWQQRKPLTGEQLDFLEERGCPSDYWNLPASRAVKHLTAAGFDLYQITELMDLPPVMTEREFLLVSASLPLVVELHAQGKTPLEISEAADVPRSTVYYHLEDLGLDPHRTRAPEITVGQESRILKLYAEGKPYDEIAERVKVTYHQVRAAIRRNREVRRA